MPRNLRPGRLASWGVLAAIVALAAALRLLVIGRDALWLDEGYSWWDAHQPFASLWSVVPQCDPHPPLYFALLHAWIAAFGDGTVALRLPSALLGVATVAVVHLAGRELDSARGKAAGRLRISTFAALLFALTPFQIYFSIEARPYALLCFGAALLTLGSLRVARASAGTDLKQALARTGPMARPAFFGRVPAGGWLAMVAGATIVVWTNNTGVLLLGAATVAFIGLWLFDRSTRKSIAPVVAAGIVVALLWAPDLPLLLSQMREVSQDFWIPAATLRGLTFELHYLVGLDAMGAAWWMVLVAAGGIALIARRVRWQLALFVGALAVLPVTFNLAIGAVLEPILIARALIGATPALALAVAAAVVLVELRALRVVLALALLTVHAIALVSFVRADHVKEPWKEVAARLAVAARGQVVLVVPNELALPLAHEARAEHLQLRVRGVPDDFPAIGKRARYPSGKCAPAVAGPDIAALIESLRTQSAVVLLTRRNNTYDPDEAVAAALLRAGFGLRHDEVFQPGDLRVMRFLRNSAPDNQVSTP